MSKQMSLFDSPAPEPKVVLSNDYVRKSLNRFIRIARDAEVMPWADDEAAEKERLFLSVSQQLPPEEGEAMRRTFLAELARLRAA